MSVFEQAMGISSGDEPVVESLLSPVSSSRNTLSGQTWQVELHDIENLDSLTEQIDELNARCLDPNPFFSTSALSACWPRMNHLLAPRGMRLLCLFEYSGDRKLLQFFAPIRRTIIGFPAKEITQILSSEYAPIGTPLLDRHTAVEAAENLFQLLAAGELRLPRIIDFTYLRTDSKTALALQSAIDRLNLRHGQSHCHQRAILYATSDVTRALGKKQQKELSRQRRRLAEMGNIDVRRGQKPSKINDALDEFLALEASGWKGRRGTALFSLRQTTAFARQMLYQMGKEGNAEIVQLVLNEKIIASLILVRQKNRWISWKIAFDETYKAYSPGVQLTYLTSQLLQADKGFAEVDSLAVENHPMIDSLWRDRIKIADLLVQLGDQIPDLLTPTQIAKQREEKLRAHARRIRKLLLKLLP